MVFLFFFVEYFLVLNIKTNNLIYTAMSRAKKTCIVIGEEEIYHNSIKKKFNRISNLNKLIIDEYNKEI
jgi:ATP-dependent exoDNAse (exonuclease V) alpha subunit